MPPTWPGWAATESWRFRRTRRWNCSTRALIVDEPFIAPARIDVAALRAHTVAVPPMFSDLITRRPGAESTTRWPPSKSKSALAQRLHGLPEAQQHAVLLDLVRSHIATVLGTATAEAIDPDKAFQELGFDSLTAVEMRNRLKTATGLALSPTLIFDYPTPNGLASYIRGELAGVHTRSSRSPAVRVTGDDQIAIVGMSCRYPGGIESPDDLWDMLAEGRDVVPSSPPTGAGIWRACTTRTPTSRVPATPAPAASSTGSPTSTRRSSASRPARRWRWIRSSGCCSSCPGKPWSGPGLTRPALRGSATGVFAGVYTQGYGMGRHDAEPRRASGSPGSPRASPRDESPTCSGLEGPAVSVDTACSSSLVALHMAVQSLRSGECDLALAGGVTVNATPDIFVEFSAHARAVRRRPLQGLRGRGRRHRILRGRRAFWWWSGFRTHSDWATLCWRWCAVPRSTRMARPTG